MKRRQFFASAARTAALFLLSFGSGEAFAQSAFVFPSSPTLNQVVTGPNNQQFKWDGTKWIAIGGASPYDLGGTLSGSPTASMVILRYPFPRPVTFPSGLTNSQGVAGTAATASTTFQINKNGTSVGTMVFAAAGTVATFTMASSTSFAIADVLTVVAPATPDTTLANLGWSLSGTR